MSFSTDLDKYLTTPPDDGFDTYFELVYEHYSENFYNNIGDFEESEQEHKWIEKLYDQDIQPEIASLIIERAYNIYKHKLRYTKEIIQ